MQNLALVCMLLGGQISEKENVPVSPTDESQNEEDILLPVVAISSLGACGNGLGAVACLASFLFLGPIGFAVGPAALLLTAAAVTWADIELLSFFGKEKRIGRHLVLGSIAAEIAYIATALFVGATAFVAIQLLHVGSYSIIGAFIYSPPLALLVAPISFVIVSFASYYSNKNDVRVHPEGPFGTFETITGMFQE